MEKIRLIHFINQFFAGIGGEDKAMVPVGSFEGAVGPGKRLQELLGDSAEIVVTAYCGDDYFGSEHKDGALASILKIAKDHDVMMVVAGPAFASGRYGFACTEVCHSVSTSLGLYCVTGMSLDNPGVMGCKEYKDRKVFAFPTGRNVAGMEDALTKMAKGVLKLAAGSTMGPASEEGYIPRGLRVLDTASKSGVKRAIDMLLDKVAGRSFITEIPVEIFEETPVAPRIVNLKDAYIVLASSAGMHPPDNPYGIKSSRNTKWAKYPITNVNSMREVEWKLIHCGINASYIEANADYGSPLDVVREMEREGAFAKLNPNFYSTTGVMGSIPDMQNIGREMAHDMKAEGVDAAIFVST